VWWPEADGPTKWLEAYDAQLLMAAGDVSRVGADVATSEREEIVPPPLRPKKNRRTLRGDERDRLREGQGSVPTRCALLENPPACWREESAYGNRYLHEQQRFSLPSVLIGARPGRPLGPYRRSSVNGVCTRLGSCRGIDAISLGAYGKRQDDDVVVDPMSDSLAISGGDRAD
jgi:hypothetical protein